MPGRRQSNPLRREVSQLVAVLLPELAQLSLQRQNPAVTPVFHGGFLGSRHFTAVFADVLEGIERVRALAAGYGVAIHIRLSECPHGATDPLAHLRGASPPWGKARVILWATGPDRIASMKALREVLRTDLAAAKQGIEALPKEVLVNVDSSYAERAAQVLRDAGCDAEAVLVGAAARR